MQAGHMISPAALQKFGKDAGRNPVGTGPYQFVEWVEQDHVTLKRNPSYWDPNAALLDEVVFRIVPDPTVRLTNLKAGELDWITTVGFKDVSAMRNNPDFQLLRTWAGADRFILNCSKPPFSNMALRQALQLAIDRAAMHRAVFFETGVIGYGPVDPPGSWAFDDNWKPFDRDLDKAKAKLKEGGQPDGFEFSILASDPVNQQIAEAYQAMFAPLGVKVNIQKVDSAKRVADQIALNYEASLSTWQMSPDPSPALYTPYHSKGSGNYLKYSNARVDELLEKAITTYDRTQRRAYYREVDQILADEAPCPIPYHRARFDAASNKVQGIAARPDPQLDLRGVSLKS
jgi:peptide/nickel transport system substrate-binding protein